MNSLERRKRIPLAIGFLMKNKISLFIVTAMLLVMALPSCHKSAPPSKDKESEDIISDNDSRIQIPDKPTEDKLVYDLAGVIDAQQEKEIEDSLESFCNQTGNQILVMTTSSIGNNDLAHYAVDLGRKWGVGQEGDNNGVVLLIKVKTESENGKAYIAPGYGVEKALPNWLCKHIIEKEMIPHFKEEKYSDGIKAGINSIMNALLRE